MAFIPKNWSNGQTVYAEDMNRIEQGIVQEPARQIEIHDKDPDAHPSLRTAIQEVQDTYEKKGVAGTAVSTHNTSTDAHNDIRVELGKKAPVPIIGTTPPTDSTVGVVGQEYIDTAAKLVYHCTSARATGYKWMSADKNLQDTCEEKGVAKTEISAHNTSSNAHNDIRVELGKKAAKTEISAHNTSPDAHNDIRVELGKKAPVPIIGTAPPTTSTVGVVGQEYIDKTNKRVWYCTAAESTGYTWILTSAGLSTKVNTTLSASGWSTAKKYTVNNANITATSAVELLPRENNGITQAQMEALSGAMIVGGTQAAGSIQLVALGDKPTTDIPVTLIIRRDL